MKKSLFYSIIFHIFIILVLVKVIHFNIVETKKLKKIPITFNAIKTPEKAIVSRIKELKELKEHSSIKNIKIKQKKDILKKTSDKIKQEDKIKGALKKLQKKIMLKKSKDSDIFSNIYLDDQKEAILFNDEENIIKNQISNHWIKTACIKVLEEIKIVAHITSNCEIIDYYVKDKNKYNNTSLEYTICADSAIRALQKIKKLAFKPNRCKELSNKKIPLNFFPNN